MDNVVCETQSKVSSSKSVVFRPGAQLRSDLDKLVAELSRPGAILTISDILREGVTTFWPQIRAHIRCRARAGDVAPEEIDITTAATVRALQLGLTSAEIETALEQCLIAKLATAPALSAPAPSAR